MCGIAGFVSLTARPADPSRLAAMVETIRHRGTDDFGHFVQGVAALGIVDRDECDVIVDLDQYWI